MSNQLSCGASLKDTNLLHLTVRRRVGSAFGMTYSREPEKARFLKLALFIFGVCSITRGERSLIVLAVSLTLGIQDTRPVSGFKVELGVDIDLDFDV
jgi:hypothetical protein